MSAELRVNEIKMKIIKSRVFVERKCYAMRMLLCFSILSNSIKGVRFNMMHFSNVVR